MLLKLNQKAYPVFLSIIISMLFCFPKLQAQNCDSGELGWTEVSNIFSVAGCTNCHGMAGGFSLVSYTSFTDGGTKCGSEITQGNTFLNIITIDNYDGCRAPIGGISMNKRADGALDSLDLLLLQRWINAGIPEFCENFCIENEIITTSLINASYHFEVDSTVTANNNIINNSNIIYEAGERISLDTGFSVDTNSDFHAFIGTCE